MQETGAIVVGAGPIGLEVAAALKRAGVAYEQFDAGQIASTIAWWAPGTKFFSSPERIAIAGVPFVTTDQEKGTREEYLAYLRMVVQQLDLRVRTYERVERVERRGSGRRFEVTTAAKDGRRAWRCDHLVLAIGDMHRPRMIGVPGEDLPHVSHYFEDPHRYFRRRVLIVGGRNSAVEAAIRCYRVGADVTLSYRRAEFSEKVKYWLRPELLSLIKEDRIAFRPLTEVERIEPERVVLKPSCFAEDPDGAREEIKADDVLLLTGYEQDPWLLEHVGVELVGARRRPRYDKRTMETNVPGVYIAGTASAGTQASGVTVFIETSHVHAERIVGAITGRETAEGVEAPEYVLPES